MHTFQLELNSTADIPDVLQKLNALSSNELDKTVFHVYLQGFKLLMESFEEKVPEAELLYLWFDNYCELLNSLPPTSHRAYIDYTRTIPIAITYAICCTAHKVLLMPDFHYNMLKRIENLLITVPAIVIERIMQRQPDLILYLTHIVKFVGDYQSQLLALRLMKILLEFESEWQFDELMEQIDIVGHAELCKIMQMNVPIFQLSIFDNLCREFLNNYNYQVHESKMVYSFNCESIDLGENTVFYKPFKADKFWIDLNYRTCSLSFEGRCLNSKTQAHEVMPVRLKLMHIAFAEDGSIRVTFVPPLVKLPFFHTNTAIIEVNKDEYAMLLDEKKLIMKFNKCPGNDIKELESRTSIAPRFSLKSPYVEETTKESKASIGSTALATASKELKPSENSQIGLKPSIKSQSQKEVLVYSTDDEQPMKKKRTSRMHYKKPKRCFFINKNLNKKNDKKNNRTSDITTSSEDLSTNSKSKHEELRNVINFDDLKETNPELNKPKTTPQKARTNKNVTSGTTLVALALGVLQSSSNNFTLTTTKIENNTANVPKKYEAKSSTTLYESAELADSDIFPKNYRFFNKFRTSFTTMHAQNPSMQTDIFNDHFNFNPQMQPVNDSDILVLPSDDSEDDGPCTSFVAAQRQRSKGRKPNSVVDQLVAELFDKHDGPNDINTQ